MSEFFRALSNQSFLQYALIVGVLVALCAALLGVSLVLKRYSMIGDGLSHVGFGALSVAMVLNVAPMAVAMPVVIAAAFLLLRMSANSKIKGDAAIALIASSALAIGITLSALTSGINTDVHGFMFGSILALSQSDVVVSVVLSVAVLVLYILFYHKLFAVTFDEDFARATGVRAGYYNMLLALLTAVTVVVGMRMMGALLISSLIIFPALTAMRVCKSYRSVIVTAAVVSVICLVVGLILSFCYPIPTGASVVLVNLAVFLLFSAAGLIVRRVR